MPSRTIVIVGGAFAGPIAAARAREIDERARIVLLERAREVNIPTCSIAQIVSGEARMPLTAQRERSEELRDTWNIEVRTGAEVTALDPKRKSVKAGRQRLEYDALVFAAGVESVLPPIDGLDGAENVSRFRTLLDVDCIQAVRSAGSRRVVVLGGGLMGIEAADALARAGWDVLLLERKARLLPSFSSVMSALARQGLEEQGVRIVTSAKVTSAERAGDSVRGLVLGRDKLLLADLVVVTAGVRPRTELLGGAGAEVHASGAVVVDEHCRTSLDSVYACGTCVAVNHAVIDAPAWTPQAAIADRTAQVAGGCAARENASISGVVATVVVRAGTMAIGRAGLSVEQSAKYAGKGGLGVAIAEAPATEPLGSHVEPVVIELRHASAHAQIIGAEVGGRSGVDKRIDVLATAIRGGLTLRDLASLDLGYAPPYSPARDPVSVAATVALSGADPASRRHARAWSASEASARGRRVTLVDVRNGAEDVATLAGAKVLPFAELRARLKELPASRPLIFIDDTGRLGYLAARIAIGRGRKDAGYVSGGLRAWRAEGLPLEEGPRR